MADNIITAYLHGQDPVSVPAVYQYNSGMILKFSGADLPAAYMVDFANNISGASISQVGGPEGVTIPDQFFAPGATIHAWVVLAGDSYAVTRHHIIIPISPRAQRTDDEPTPSQQSALDEAIGALNTAVETVEEIAEGIPQTIQTALTEAKESGEFDGEPGQDGISPEISVTAITGGNRITITDATGTKTVDVLDGTNGDNGVGISSVAKTGTSGLVDTYTITYTDGTTSAFTVTNGQNGTDGATFIPAVSAEGVISWTNDGGKTNPQSANIKGPPGSTPTISIGTVSTLEPGQNATVTKSGTDAAPVFSFGIPKGQQGEPGDDYILTAQDKADIAALVSDAIVETVTGANPVIAGVANHRYMCGEVATISITPPASGIIDVVFSSGTTATVLTVPSTVKWPDWFDPSSLDASANYEINIMDGVYGAVMMWS